MRGWDLVAIQGGKATRARYQSNIDMAGSLPIWLVRSGPAKELPKFFRTICSALPEPHSKGSPAEK